MSKINDRQKDIIIPEYSSLVASVEQEVALYLGTLHAGFMALSNHPLPTEHIWMWSGALQPLSKIIPEEMKCTNALSVACWRGLGVTAPKPGTVHLQSPPSP